MHPSSAVRPNAAMRIASRVFALVIVLTGLSFYLAAESPSFKVYTTQEGLAHDFVNQIVRDSRGFLWLCTSEGLSRFDGSRFTNFTPDQGLSHRNINAFFETRNGTYLIGTSYGVAIFDPNGAPYRWNVLEQRLEQTSDESPMFRTFVPPGRNRQSKVILSLAEDRDGTLWVGTAYGLYRAALTEREMTFEEVNVDNGQSFGFYQFLDDGEGGMIVVTSYGIYRIFRGSIERQDRPGARSILRALDGKIWIGASGEPTGIRVYELVNGRLKLLERYTTKDGLLVDTFQNAIWQLKDGSIFIGLATGFQEFIPDAKPGRPKFRTLGTDIVNTLAEDPAGNLWLGTELKGAWQLIRSGFVSFGEKDGISESEDIRAIYIDPAGGIYLPTRPTRILRLGENGIFSAVYPYGIKNRSWGWTHLDFISKDGEWWVPGSDGLRRYPKVSRFEDLGRTPPKRIYTKKDGLHGNEAFMMFEDSRGDIWIATDTGGGEDCLARWNRKTDTITSFSSLGGLPKNNGPVSYAEDKHGNVWIGYFFGGLARFKDGRFRFFTAADGMSESMPGALHVDGSGRLWIGTTGQGIYRVDDPNGDEPVFTNISTRSGLSSNQVSCLTSDRFQQIYAGTGRGINRLNLKGNIDVFTQADGLPSNFITRCARDNSGALWFVSRNTLVRYTPQEKEIGVPAAVYIDKVSVNGNAQKISALGETDITLPDLAPGQNQIQIHFFALTFGSGENIRYQYSLDGQEWSQPTAEQTINLDLSPDKHVFGVRAVLSSGATSERSAVLNMVLLRPVWQRWWFLAVAALLLGGIVVFAYRYRIENLRRINAALREANLAEEALRRTRDERVAELEQVRSRIATDLHDDIGSSLTQIAVLSEVAQTHVGAGNGGPTEPLRKITEVSNELVGTMSDIVWAINPSKDHLSDLTQRMRRVASDMLSPKGIVVHFRSDEEHRELKVRTNARREFLLIFKESVNNIAKHAGARNVYIDLQTEGDLLALRIRDDGKGFDLDPQSPDDSPSSEGRGGNGLRNMRKRAAEMNGRFDITSVPGHGTSIVLTLPPDAGTDTAIEPNFTAR
jgi:signal transduction histidine kinase/ligand-binding sensor domain-containing protein